MTRDQLLLIGRWTGRIAAGLGVFAVFFVLGALIRLLSGPVSLGPFSDRLSDALNNAVPGLAVRYDSAAVQWSRDEGRINLVVLGAKVFDRRGRIIAQAPKAEVDLAAAPILEGRAVVQRIALVGVQLTLVHTMDGALRLGVERDTAQSDLLERLREALSKGGGTSSLKGFAIRRARLAFYDERTGLFVVAPEASLQISSPGKPGEVEANITAQVEISGHRAALTTRLDFPRDGDAISGDVSLKSLELDALGRNAKALSFLQPLQLTADITGSFVLDHGSTRVAFADFGFGAAGRIVGLGHPLHVKQLKLVGRYDGRTGRVLIDDGTLEGNELKARLSGSGNLFFDPTGALKRSTADLALDKIAANMPGVMQNQVAISHASLRADYTLADGKIAIEQVVVSSGPLSATASGTVTLAGDKTPAVALTGHIAKLKLAELLHYWPLAAASGARDWVSRSMSGGTVGPVAIKADIPAGGFDAPFLPDTALSVAFPIEGTSITYVVGLAPIANASGTATLLGDTFKAENLTGTVHAPGGGGLALSGGAVVIPNLHAPSNTGEIKAHIDGSVADVLAVIDMKPLNYPTRFHIGMATARGRSAIDLGFRVPMRHDLKVDDLGIDISGAMTGLALTLGDRSFTDGTAKLHIDNAALRVAGNINLAGAILDVTWDEEFKSPNPLTTQITAAGTLDDAARERLGFPLRQYLKGPLPVEAKIAGHRGEIRSATVDAKLSQTAITMDVINYRKPVGVGAQVHLTTAFAKGVPVSGEMVLSGAGLNAQGRAAFGPGGHLARLEMPVVRAGPLNDFSVLLSDTPAAGLKLVISGRSADGTGLGRVKLDDEAPAADSAKPSTARFQVEANLDRLALREGVVLAPFALNVSGIGDKPLSLALSGDLSKTAKLSGSLALADGERHLHLQSADAGLLLRGLFGFTSLRGGKFELNAVLSPTPTKAELAAKRAPDYRGELSIKDFTVADQPFLARLFSAGSFVGLADLMDGKGIAVDRLTVPFHMQGGVLGIEEARASGPSIGITASGYLDRRSDKLALEGALVPVFGINSVLGSIPVLGDLFVSKKGEGIFGMSYDVSGNADEPKIAVNPVSVLAPGILRRIFEGSPKAPLIAEPKPAPKKDAPPQ